MRNATSYSVMLLLAALLACKSKADGNVTVDGAAFEIDSCRSGQANIPKFDGVDLLDESGRRVRFMVNPDGSLRTFLFAAGATQGDLVGEGCGTISVTTQNSEVNGVKNVQGNVSANCTGAGHTIVATANFKNCH